MRVLFTHRPGGAYGYISESWMNICKNVGITVSRWDGNAASWDAFDPDLYIGCSGHKQNVPPNRRAKVAIHVNPYGPVDMGPINEPVDSIKWVTRVAPDAVFGYGFEKDRHYWSYWSEKLGAKWVPMANAADFTLFNTTYEASQRNIDIVYIGGKWPYKSRSIDAYLLPLFDGRLSYTIGGWGDWDKKYDVKHYTDFEVPGVLASAKIGPCISEPHTHQYGIDVPERVFKIIMSGTVAIHDNTRSLADQIPSLIIAGDPNEFRDLCHYWAGVDDATRIKKSNEQRADVLNGHTYAHRLAKMFSELGFQEQATQLLGSVPRI